VLSGQALKELRENQGLTLEQVAERSGLPCSFLRDLEQGRRKLSARSMARLASVLPVDERTVDPNWWEKSTAGLGDKIRALRLARDLTLKEMGSLTGLSPTYLSELERGNIVPALATLKSIAEALNIPVSLLINNRRKASPVGEKLKRLRALRGISQKDLAAMAGISPGLVAQLETGRVQASLDTVERIAGVLGVSVCYLILEQEEVEAIVGALSPELRELLYHPHVQVVLGSICAMDKEKLRMALNFIDMLNNPRI